ncbi:putative amino acid permease [Panicum miliaceum]|uniref:Amino acid permease n=1 Tax=Panicum miliaceum TaxID=4540 RepID=A0A3L6RBC3_PANMI|nr:putative amino acid permease [Panicum miliaceum]
MTLGWHVVASFNGCAAHSMAEICSVNRPPAGRLDYWSAKLESPATTGRPWPPGSSPDGACFRSFLS